MLQKNLGVYVGSKIPNILRASIEKAVLAGKYLNISDFVRDAIKEKIERERIPVTVGQNEDPRNGTELDNVGGHLSSTGPKSIISGGSPK
jgi:Arc/MetJ-type ribon-helix-helix transcriptional regulator